MKLENLTISEQYYIAEYLYSYKMDILIKKDLEKVLEVLTNHSHASRLPDYLKSLTPKQVYDLILTELGFKNIKTLMLSYINLELKP